MKITLEVKVTILIIISSSNMKEDLKGIGLESKERIHMAQDRDRP